ncbi:MAG: hypothetical protein [Hangzhou altica cyanea chuvirus 1]|nr:MAG: hypothetical protein [Hangzhou altica cyanea chuvirus 1]
MAESGSTSGRVAGTAGPSVSRGGVSRARPNEIRKVGVCDSPAFFKKFLKIDDFYKTLMIENLNVYPFVAPWTHESLVPMTTLATIGRKLLGVVEKRAYVREEELFGVTMAELMAPCIRKEIILAKEPAQALFVESVKALLFASTENLNQFTSVTKTDIETQLNAITEVSASNERTAKETIPDDNHFVGHLSNEAVVGFKDLHLIPVPLESTYDMTPSQAAGILYLMSIGGAKFVLRNGLTLIANTLVAITKRGNFTTSFKAKIENGIKADLAADVTISVDACRILYTNYSDAITAENVVDVFNRWKIQVPKQAMRLSLLVAQSAGSGLTIFTTIQNAMRVHSRFRWHVVAKLLPNDWANLITAANLIKGNMFYGFNRDLGDAAGAKYRNIGWVAKELLIRASGDQFIGQYRGWPSVVPEQYVLSRMIDEYTRNNSEGEAPITMTEVDELRNLYMAMKLEIPTSLFYDYSLEPGTGTAGDDDNAESDT